MMSQSTRRSDGRRLRWAEHRAERRAAFVAAGVAAVDEHGPRRQRRADRRGGRRQPHRAVPLLQATRTTCARPIADQIVGRVIASVMPHLVARRRVDPARRHHSDDRRRSSAGSTSTRTSTRSCASSSPSLGAVETTLADRVAYLLQGADGVLRHRRATRPSPARTGSSASSSRAAPGGSRAATSRRRCRASGSPTACARRSGTCSTGFARASGITRLRRPAAVRGAGAEER